MNKPMIIVSAYSIVNNDLMYVDVRCCCFSLLILLVALSFSVSFSSFLTHSWYKKLTRDFAAERSLVTRPPKETHNSPKKVHHPTTFTAACIQHVKRGRPSLAFERFRTRADGGKWRRAVAGTSNSGNWVGTRSLQKDWTPPPPPTHGTHLWKHPKRRQEPSRRRTELTGAPSASVPCLANLLSISHNTIRVLGATRTRCPITRRNASN